MYLVIGALILAGTYAAGDGLGRALFPNEPNAPMWLLYTALISKYSAGAYYPTEHFASLINGVANAVTREPGCDIFYNTEVARVRMDRGRVAAIIATDGREFVGDKVICNADPKCKGGLTTCSLDPGSSSDALAGLSLTGLALAFALRRRRKAACAH